MAEFFFADRKTGQMPTVLDIDDVKALHEDFYCNLEKMHEFLKTKYSFFSTYSSLS